MRVMRFSKGLIFRNAYAGAIAGVIYVCIALPNGIAAAPAILFGVLLGLATFVVAFAISQFFIRLHRERA